VNIGFLLQGPSEAGSGVPFLTIEADRKLTLHPLPPPLECGASVREDAIVVVADQPCAMEKWVHIGCEVRLCGLYSEISFRSASF
jgi:hypothetical protein